MDYEHSKTTSWPIPKKNEAWFEIKFSPHFNVKEELIMFDLVSMVSAIGGTMGLCVGFSFLEIYGCLCKWIKLGLKKFRDQKDITPDRALNEQGTQTTVGGYFVKTDMKHHISTHDKRLLAVEEKIKILCLNLKDAV